MPEGNGGSRASEAGTEQSGMEQLVAARRAKIERLRAEGREPYPARSPTRTHLAQQARAAFEAEEAAGREGPRDVRLNGRLVGAVRHMGGSAFAHLADTSGQVQLHLRRNVVGEEPFASFIVNVDAGDIVSASGWMFRTRRGEVSLAVEELVVLAKSLLPLPDKWHGLTDVETRFRQRHLDLLSNEASRQRFVARSRIVSTTRRFLEDRGFLEVETPILQPIYGGGAAAPFTTHYAALNQDMYLRIADELYLKRLLVGGMEKVFEIGKDFRNEGIDRTHLPEFTQMECYWAFADYTDMMALTEDLVASVAREILGTTEIVYQGEVVDLAPPWRRLTVRDALRDAGGVDLEEATSLESLQAALAGAGIAAEEQPTWAKAVDKLLQRLVEPHLVAPTFLTDYPVTLSPLAKRKPSAPGYAERFEPFIGGLEIGNAFTELNDPLDQRERFDTLAMARAQGDVDAHPLDEDFLAALMHGMPPAGGLGIGMDRLVMLLTGEANIREVVLFPQLRPQEKQTPGA